MALIIAFGFLSLTQALVPPYSVSPDAPFLQGKGPNITAAIASIIPSDFWSSTEPVKLNTTNPVENANVTFCLPTSDPDPSGRAVGLRQDAYGYQYSQSLIGESSLFIGGVKGFQVMYRDIGLWLKDAGTQRAHVQAESAVVNKTLTAAGGIQNESSFDILYKGQWAQSNPDGIAPGISTNYTQDLLFSMERLSINPFPVRRIRPKTALPFQVDDKIVQKLSGQTLNYLRDKGLLFIVDHSYQSKYTTVPGRFNAACIALFYIHPKTRDFLPLAIQTKPGNDLIYTPEDSRDDWLLAKIMFNVNDQFHAQILHLGNSHAVAEIVHEAAIRTMSERHPVRAFLDYIMYQAYAIRPIGSQILFNPSGLFEQNFSLDRHSVQKFVSEFYPTEAGPVQSNYLYTNVVNRGLIDSKDGPDLKSFPWYEDAKQIVDALREFATYYVNYYYPNVKLYSGDQELQNWVKEANNVAKVIDFPTAITSRVALIDILTHMAYLTGVNHHTLNSGALAANSGTLPFHPAALYKEVPDKKGVDSVLPYLPNTQAAVSQATLFCGFVRPNLFNADGSLESVFERSTFLSGVPDAVKNYVSKLQSRLKTISSTIQSRSFDEKGLAQGMPFIWRNLDPAKVPFFLAI